MAALDMSAVKGVKLDYALPTTSAKTVEDFDYAEDENRIYLSVGIGDANLDGIITWMEAPFNEGDNWTVYRATSFLMSNYPVWMEILFRQPIQMDPSSVYRCPNRNYFRMKISMETGFLSPD